MPARTVVLEKLVKYNGESHVDITPGEYTQLTGRAGRRGIDVEGHAVVLWQTNFDPRAVAGLASRRTYPLRSSFAPTYNMAVNLMATLGRERARDLLNQSFAQFQTDKSVVTAAGSGGGCRPTWPRRARPSSATWATSWSTRGCATRSPGWRRPRRRRGSASTPRPWPTITTPAARRPRPRAPPGLVRGAAGGTEGAARGDPWVQVISADHTVLKLQPHDLRRPAAPRRARPGAARLLPAGPQGPPFVADRDVGQARAARPEIPDTALPSDDAVAARDRRPARRAEGAPVPRVPRPGGARRGGGPGAAARARGRAASRPT